MAYNKFRRAYEAIEENLLKIEGFDGKIVGGFFRAGNTQEELVQIYGPFHTDKGSAIEIMQERMITGEVGEFGNLVDKIRFNIRFMYSYRQKADGNYAGSSQEEFDKICAGITDAFADTISSSTGESKYYQIFPIDLDTVVFPGAESFGLSEFSELEKLVHMMEFKLDVFLETT